MNILIRELALCTWNIPLGHHGRHRGDRLRLDAKFSTSESATLRFVRAPEGRDIKGALIPVYIQYLPHEILVEGYFRRQTSGRRVGVQSSPVRQFGRPLRWVHLVRMWFIMHQSTAIGFIGNGGKRVLVISPVIFGSNRFSVNAWILVGVESFRICWGC